MDVYFFRLWGETKGSLPAGPACNFLLFPSSSLQNQVSAAYSLAAAIVISPMFPLSVFIFEKRERAWR